MKKFYSLKPNILADAVFLFMDVELNRSNLETFLGSRSNIAIAYVVFDAGHQCHVIQHAHDKEHSSNGRRNCSHGDDVARNGSVH